MISVIEGDQDAIRRDHYFFANYDLGFIPIEQAVVRDMAAIPDGYSALEIDISGDETRFRN